MEWKKEFLDVWRGFFGVGEGEGWMGNEFSGKGSSNSNLRTENVL